MNPQRRPYGSCERHGVTECPNCVLLMPHWLKIGRNGNWPRISPYAHRISHADLPATARNAQFCVSTAPIRNAVSLSVCSGGLPAMPWMNPEHLATEADKFYKVYREMRPPYLTEGGDRVERHFGVTLSSVSTYMDAVNYVVPGGMPFLRRMAIGLSLVLARTPAIRLSDDVCVRAPATNIPPSESVLSVVEDKNKVELCITPTMTSFESNVQYVNRHSSGLSVQESLISYVPRPSTSAAAAADASDDNGAAGPSNGSSNGSRHGSRNGAGLSAASAKKRRLRMEDPSFSVVRREQPPTMSAIDIVVRQCIQHVFQVYRTLNSKMEVWCATPDSQAILDEWNQLLQHCGASVHFYFTSTDFETDTDKEILAKARQLGREQQQQPAATDAAAEEVAPVATAVGPSTAAAAAEAMAAPKLKRRNCGSKGSGSISSRSSVRWSQRYHVSSPLPHRSFGISSHRKFKVGWFILRRMASNPPSVIRKKLRIKKAPLLRRRRSSSDSSNSENETGRDFDAEMLTSDGEVSSNTDDDSDSSGSGRKRSSNGGGGDGGDPAVPRRKRVIEDEEILYSGSSDGGTEYFVNVDNMMFQKYDEDMPDYEKGDMQRQFRILNAGTTTRRHATECIENARYSCYYRSRCTKDWRDTKDVHSMSLCYASSVPYTYVATAAAADVLTAHRQWHAAESAGGASGVELRVAPFADADVVGCSDTRKIKALTALYMFLHLHGHHVRKLRVTSNSYAPIGTVDTARNNVMSNVVLQALRMCTQVRVLEATEIAISDACLASLGSTVNVIEVNVTNNMRVRGPEASLAAPVANGTLPRDHTISTSGLTLSWPNRLVNAALASKCDEEEVCNGGERSANEEDAAFKMCEALSSVRAERCAPLDLGITSYAPNITKLVMYNPPTFGQLDAFLDAARLCSATLEHFELLGEDDCVDGVLSMLMFRYPHKRTTVASLMDTISLNTMLRIRVFKIMKVCTVTDDDVEYFATHVPEEAPLTEFGLMSTAFERKISTTKSVAGYVALIRKHRATLEHMYINLVRNDIVEPLIEAVADARLLGGGGGGGTKLRVSYALRTDCNPGKVVDAMRSKEMREAQLAIMRASDANRNADAEYDRLAKVIAKYDTLQDGALIAIPDALMPPSDIAPGSYVWTLDLGMYNMPRTAHNILWLHTLGICIPRDNSYARNGNQDEAVASFVRLFRTTSMLKCLKCLHLYQKGMDYESVTRGFPDTPSCMNRMQNLRMGIVGSEVGISETIVDTLTSIDVFQGLNELYLGFVLSGGATEECTRSLAEWVTNHQNLRSLYVLTTSSLSNQLCKHMISFGMEQKNHCLVDFSTMPCWSKSATSARAIVNRNAAELQRSAAYVLGFGGKGWGPLSFEVYRNHPSLPVLVADMGDMSVDQARRKIEQRPKIKFEEFEQSMNSLCFDLPPPRRSAEEEEEEMDVVTAEKEPMWSHLFATSNDAWQRVFLCLSHSDLREILLKGIKSKSAACKKCSYSETAQDELDRPAAVPARYPMWVMDLVPEISPQIFVGQPLASATMEVLHNEMMYAHFAVSRSRMHMKDCAFDEERTSRIERVARRLGIEGANGILKCRRPLDAFQDYVLAEKKSPGIAGFLYERDRDQRCGCESCLCYYGLQHAGVALGGIKE